MFRLVLSIILIVLFACGSISCAHKPTSPYKPEEDTEIFSGPPDVVISVDHTEVARIGDINKYAPVYRIYVYGWRDHSNACNFRIKAEMFPRDVPIRDIKISYANGKSDPGAIVYHDVIEYVTIKIKTCNAEQGIG